MARTVLVCGVQVPFVSGGAELLGRSLTAEFARRGFDVEQVNLPFKSYPKEEILTHAAAWRLLDLSESNGRPVDLVIGTKFPSYWVRHPCKVAWVMHQYRAAYELCGTEFSDFDHVERDVALRAALVELDTRMLRECRRIYTLSRNTARRLKTYNGIDAEPLYHPSHLADRLYDAPAESYVLSVARLEPVKRISMAIEAMVHVDPRIRLVHVGDGSQGKQCRALVERLGLGDRVHFAGTIDDDALVKLYAHALAVVYAPYDEDYGYVTLEAFLARKPVITASDSGGTLEFVEDGVNGAVCDPAPEALAAAINAYARDPRRAAEHGNAGYERARLVTWDGVVERLTDVQ
ncbi:MAG TPA: glycosyltransferase family 4 protein [Vicinamibacterales bacterium]|nr:glycosyltransferase family 4 protein [Vicinamibacterales bacterium]